MTTTTITDQKVLRTLHVGVANRGIWPLQRCKPEVGFTPVALCDVGPEALAKGRELTGLGESACFNDIDKALDQVDVDAVIICAPTTFHVTLATKAIERGKPVLMEKGMAPNWADAKQLVDLVQQKDSILAIAQNYRYNAVERTVYRAINDPQHPAYLGPVHLLTYTQHRVRPNPRTLTFPFASVWDMSCHHFDNMLYWLGAMKEMTAFSFAADWSAYKYDNNTGAHIVMDSGINVQYMHTHDAARGSLEIQVHGERGALVVEGKKITFNERPTEQFGKRPVVDVELEAGDSEADVLDAFYQYITQGIEPGISARNNLETMAACEMMVRSAQNHNTCRRSDLD